MIKIDNLVKTYRTEDNEICVITDVISQKNEREFLAIMSRQGLVNLHY